MQEKKVVFTPEKFVAIYEGITDKGLKSKIAIQICLECELSQSAFYYRNKNKGWKRIELEVIQDVLERNCISGY